MTTRAFRYDTTVPSFQETSYDDYRWMRDHAPLYRDETTGTYALTRHADV